MSSVSNSVSGDLTALTIRLVVLLLGLMGSILVLYFYFKVLYPSCSASISKVLTVILKADVFSDTQQPEVWTREKVWCWWFQSWRLHRGATFRNKWSRIYISHSDEESVTMLQTAVTSITWEETPSFHETSSLCFQVQESSRFTWFRRLKRNNPQFGFFCCHSVPAAVLEICVGQ